MSDAILLNQHAQQYNLKTSSTRFQCNNISSSKTSWRHLQDVFKTSWKKRNCYVENVLKTSWRCFKDMSRLKTSWRNIFKTSSRCFGDNTSSRCLGDKQFLLRISVSNKSKCVSHKSIFHQSISDEPKTNPKCIN